MPPSYDMESFNCSPGVFHITAERFIVHNHYFIESGATKDYIIHIIIMANLKTYSPFIGCIDARCTAHGKNHYRHAHNNNIMSIVNE